MPAKRIHNLDSLEGVRKNLRNSLTPAEAILLNIRVIRFENRIVFENLEGVLEAIRRHLRDVG